MIVSDPHKFVFIHNPKTAGMSIRNAIFQFDRRNKYSDEKLMHLTMEQVHQQFPEVIEKMKEYYTFMLVRNPFTRCISSFSFHSPSVYKKYCETGNLEEYRNRFEQILDLMTPESLSEWYFHPFIRQVDMAYYNGVTYVDDFFKFEELPECLSAIETKHYTLSRMLRNLSHDNHLPMLHTPQQIYTDKALKKVIELYKDDFETFKYSKEL
jgi:hypothetical protein